MIVWSYHLISINTQFHTLRRTTCGIYISKKLLLCALGGFLNCHNSFGIGRSYIELHHLHQHSLASRRQGKYVILSCLYRSLQVIAIKRHISRTANRYHFGITLHVEPQLVVMLHDTATEIAKIKTILLQVIIRIGRSHLDDGITRSASVHLLILLVTGRCIKRILFKTFHGKLQLLLCIQLDIANQQEKNQIK